MHKRQVIVISSSVFIMLAVAASLLLWASEPAEAATLTVNSTADLFDGGCDPLPGNCTLKEAVVLANANDTINFAIPAATDPGCNAGTGVCVLKPFSMPVIFDNNLTIDGYSQAGATENTLAAGSNAAIKIEIDESLEINDVSPFRVNADNVTIRGLAINHLLGQTHAIQVMTDASGAQIEGNFIGVTPDGLQDASAGGRQPAGSGSELHAGVFVDGASGNTIGGTDPADRNIFSNSAWGVRIDGGSGNYVLGNLIGTDATGTERIGNDVGVNISFGATDNHVGDGSAGGRNVISANFTGVIFEDAGENFVQGNYIGTNATGDDSVGNGDSGVSVDDSTDVRIGGLGGLGNLLSGNFGGGVEVNGSTGTRVTGNIIGLDATGTQEVHNGLGGIEIDDSPNTIVGGGQNAARNVIGRNSGYGVEVSGNSAGTEIKRNLIGTDISGSVGMFNNPGGVAVDSPGVLVELNVISGNNGEGILVEAGGDGLTVRTNRIGVALNDLSELANLGNGIFVDDGATNVLIGGTGNVDGNIIGFSSSHGVKVAGGASSTSTVRILRNSIAGNGNLGIDLGNDSDPTPNDTDDVDTGPNGMQNYPELTSAMSGSLVVSGTLNSTPNRLFRMELFSSPACDETDFGEGRVFRGSVQLTTDTDGDVEFTAQSGATVPVGNYITATATDTVTGSTSEFSECVPITALPSPTPTPVGQTPGPTPIVIETPGPTVTPTEEPTPTPAPTPTPTPSAPPQPSGPTPAPTPSGSPTPTSSPIPTGSPELRQGDVDCSGQVTGRDALLLVGDEAGAAVSQFVPCPTVGSGDSAFGDVDCDGDVDIDDAIAVLLWLADLEMVQPTGCVEIGELFAI